MQSTRLLARSAARRGLLSAVPRRYKTYSEPSTKENERVHSTAEEHRNYQKEKAHNPHMTNTNSTIDNDMPSVGADSPPPDLISSVDSKYVPKDRIPENTEKMTGGTQPGEPNKVSSSEFGVGEMEGITFRVAPLRRTGEDLTTMRARLLCPFIPCTRGSPSRVCN